jgi:hypothetical protein
MGVIHDPKGALLHRRLVLGLGAFSAVAVLDGLQNVARAESGGIKLTVLYAKPKDSDAFNKYYLNKHMPLVAKIPGLQRTELATILPPAPDNQSRHIGGSQSFISRASTISKRARIRGG